MQLCKVSDWFIFYGGITLTRNMDRQMDGWADKVNPIYTLDGRTRWILYTPWMGGQGEFYIPPSKSCLQGYKDKYNG